MARRIRRMTPDEERSIGRRIQEADESAARAVRRVPEAARVLGRAGGHSERTRGKWVERLGEAVQVATQAGRADERHREAARAAREAWDTGEALRWELAMTAKPIAIGEARKLGGAWLDQQDLIQEGVIGLLEAARRYDPERKIRFHTYARWWVRAQMTRAIDRTGRSIRLPGGAVEQLRNMRKVVESYERAGRSWTSADLAREVGIEEERVQLLLSRGTTVSLDEPVEDGRKPRKVEHFVADEDAADPTEVLAETEELDRVRECVTRLLTERHKYVIEKRYGLDGGRPCTLAEVGRRLRLSRERVRQLEIQALVLLRDRGGIREVAA